MKKLSIGIMLKTYRPDLELVERLLDSFIRNNPENLPMTLVVPESDKTVFEHLTSELVDIVLDENLPTDYLPESTEGSEVGIKNAGAAKLAFGLTGKYDSFFSIDSDAEFIRPIRTQDFFSPDGRPYLVASEFSNQLIDPFYFNRYEPHRIDAIRHVSQELGFTNPLLLNANTGQFMSCDVIESLKSQFMAPLGWDFADLMNQAIFEYFWYTIWALSRYPNNFERRDEFIRVVHHQGEHLALSQSGIKKQDLARAYLGVIVNSNWSRQYGIVDFDNPPEDLYLSQGAWAEWNRNRLSQ